MSAAAVAPLGPEAEASAARNRGWSVIPVRVDKKPPLKWKIYQQECPTQAEIERWSQEYHPDGWAVITGEVSGIVVLDFDGDKGRETLRKLGLNPHVRTGSGGFHVYLQHPGSRVQTLNSTSKRELGERYPGLDIRADGGYTVFTGRNESGTYQWLREPKPDPLDILLGPL